MDTNTMFEQSHLQQETLLSFGFEELSDRELEEVNGAGIFEGIGSGVGGFIGNLHGQADYDASHSNVTKNEHDRFVAGVNGGKKGVENGASIGHWIDSHLPFGI